jgi:hypothetical protein
MKKINWLMLCLLSITGSACAQDNDKQPPSPGKLFELPPYSIREAFRINLGRNNQLWLELGEMQDLARWSNLDSLLQVFVSDMKAFRDSLSDPATTKRIDYVIDPAGRKKIRIRQSRLPGATFLIDKGEPALLKLEQDTINILLMYPSSEGTRYDRLNFLINQYDDLESFLNKDLNNKMQLLRQNINGYSIGKNWTRGNRARYLNADSSITKMQRIPGNLAKAGGSTLELDAGALVNAQNYRNYFTPSFSLSMSVAVTVAGNQHRLNVAWEPMFFFSTDAQGHAQTSHNDFLTFSYRYRKIKKQGAAPLNESSGIHAALSFGYLVNREGSLFPKNSYRFSAAQYSLLHGNVLLEPCMYFHDFLRGVTPGIRISIGGFLF